jgi:uncharacterized phage infection (PIP) family protein YhgE
MIAYFSKLILTSFAFYAVLAFAQGEEEYTGPVGQKVAELKGVSASTEEKLANRNESKTETSAEAKPTAEAETHESAEAQESSEKHETTEAPAESGKAVQVGEKGNGLIWFVVVSVVLLVLVFAFT